MPSGSATSAAKMNETVINSRVAGSRSRIMTLTGWPVVKLIPKSPVSTAPSQLMYWM